MAEDAYISTESTSGPGSNLAPLGSENEEAHLLRVANELGASNRRAVAALAARLQSENGEERRDAARRLGLFGDRESIALLRGLLQSADPASWEIAVHGLRTGGHREGWLCLEGVALDSVALLASDEPRVHRPAAERLLTMGRTKTMDRLFRAADGHSRSIPAVAARRFVEIALDSLPQEHGRVLALRTGGGKGPGRTVDEVSRELRLDHETVRRLETQAWEMIQRPRPYSDVSRSAGCRHEDTGGVR